MRSIGSDRVEGGAYGINGSDANLPATPDMMRHGDGATRSSI